MTTTKHHLPSERILAPVGLALDDVNGWNVYATGQAVREILRYLDECAAAAHPAPASPTSTYWLLGRTDKPHPCWAAVSSRRWFQFTYNRDEAERYTSKAEAERALCTRHDKGILRVEEHEDVPAPASPPGEGRADVCACDDDMYGRRGIHMGECPLATLEDLRRELKAARPVNDIFVRMREERDALKARVEALLRDTEALKKRRDIDVMEATDEADTAGRKLTESRARIQQLEGELADEKAGHEFTKTQLRVAVGDAKQFARERDEALAECDELKLKVSALEAETMTLTSERDTARMTQDELRRELEEAEARVLKERDAGVACYGEANGPR